MPTRATPPHGAPCWVDLTTTDVERSRDFYGRLFGWSADEPQEQYGGYFTFRRDDVPVAGCMASRGQGPDHWSVYLATDDAAATHASALAAGGHSLTDAMTVGELGTMALLTDPTGATVGLWQADQFQGITVLAEQGAPSWFELSTPEYEPALDFYRKVFGWQTRVVSDKAESLYSTANDGDDQLAGVMAAPGSPPLWSVFFGVADADAALATIVELGGAVTIAPLDTPYGRLAAAADATGATFKLVAPNDAMPASPQT